MASVASTVNQTSICEGFLQGSRYELVRPCPRRLRVARVPGEETFDRSGMQFQLSLLSTRLAEEDVVRSVTWREGGPPVGALPVARVFGANASGKSNVVKAMDDMKGNAPHSFRTGSPTGGIARRPFLLDQAAQREASRFEVVAGSGGCAPRVRVRSPMTIRSGRSGAYRYQHGKAVRLFHRWAMRLSLAPLNVSKAARSGLAPPRRRLVPAHSCLRQLLCCSRFMPGLPEPPARRGVVAASSGRHDHPVAG